MFSDKGNEALTNICVHIAVVGGGVEPDYLPPAIFSFPGRLGSFIGRGRCRRINELEVAGVSTVAEGLLVVRFGILERITITRQG